MSAVPAANGRYTLGGSRPLPTDVTAPDMRGAPDATVDRIERRASLPPDASSAAAARTFLRRALDDWNMASIEPAASLLATELTTNALLHGGGPSSMAVSVRGDRLRIAVADRESSRVPRRQHRALTAENGRGMTLVEAFSDTWGTSRPRWRRGKVVWCEIAIDGTANAPQPVLKESTRSSRFRRPNR